MPLSQISLLSVLKGCYQNVDANQMLSGKKAAQAFLYSLGSKRNTSISAEIQNGVIFKRTRSNLSIHMCRHVSCGSVGVRLAEWGCWRTLIFLHVVSVKTLNQIALRRFRCRWDNIKMVLNEICLKDVYQIRQVQYEVR